jgi:hypothetical protein
MVATSIASPSTVFSSAATTSSKVGR